MASKDPLIGFPRVLILFALIAFANFMGLLIVPALSDIAKSLQTSPASAAKLVSIFLVGCALGPLLYGPIANRWGRKGAIVMGTMIAFLGSILAYYSYNLLFLCIARFIQALGSAVGLKIAFTMVGDLYKGQKAARILSTLMMAFGLMPGFATILGGFITDLFGWRTCFLLMAGFALFLLFITRFLPETAPEKKPLYLREIFQNYFKWFKCSFVMFHALLAGLATSANYVFLTLSSYIGIDRIGLSSSEFGLWSAFSSSGFFTGAFVSRLFSKTEPKTSILAGILLFVASVAILSILFATQLINVWTLFIPGFLANNANNIIWSNSLAHGLTAATDKSNASAVMQLLNMSMATAFVLLIGVVPPTTQMLLPSVLSLIFVGMGLIFLKLKSYNY